MRAAGKANDPEVRRAIDIDRACDYAADRMSAFSAITDVNTGRLFAGAHSDFRRGLSRRRRIIGRSIEVECGSPAILPSASPYANQIRAWLEAEESVDSSIISPSFLHNVSRGNRAIVIISRVFQTDRDGDHRSILCVRDASRDDSPLFQRDCHGGAGLEVKIIWLIGSLGCVN